MIFLISLLFITILSLNIISASQIDNDQINSNQINNDQIDASKIDTKQVDAKIDAKEIETSKKDNELENIGETGKGNKKIQSDEIDSTLRKDDSAKTNSSDDELSKNQTNSTVKDNETNIIVKNSSVVKEKNLEIQLVDSKKKAIANRKVSISIGKKTYTETTDKNGKLSLKISLSPGKYTVKIKFDGDSDYAKANKTFTMNVYKLKTKFIVPYESIIRGKYFYAYLKDQNGNPLASKLVHITYRNKIYDKMTNKNGRIQLKINAKPGKYKIKLKYKGTKTYLIGIKRLTIKSYNTKTAISLDSKSVNKNKCLRVNLLYKTKKALANKKLTIRFAKKNYKRTTDNEGKAYLKLSKAPGTYKVKIRFDGAKGFKKSSLSTKIKIVNDEIIEFFKQNKTAHRNSAKSLRYYMKLVDSNGNPIVGENVTVKVKCNNFTAGTGRKITKKTIVLSSDNINNKKIDKKRLNDIAKVLRAKGYKVIVYGIGPSYHVKSVKKYKNVCVFSLVGGIDSGMFVDMASSYYQNYLKKNNNQFVLGCLDTYTKVNLANRVWLKRAHDDNYSPKKFKGKYFPGAYLNKKVHVDYVYGSNAEQLANNFIKYAVKGKSIGMHNTIPNSYVTYTLTTSKKGYVHVDLNIGNYTVIYSLINANYNTESITSWVNVVK